jgi:hypothetical protein
MLVLIWVLVKAIELIARMLMAHPDSKLLWLPLVSTVGLVVIAALLSFHLAVLNILTCLSFGGLLLSAKTTEIYFGQLGGRQSNPEIGLDQVLPQPWFDLPGRMR